MPEQQPSTPPALPQRESRPEYLGVGVALMIPAFVAWADIVNFPIPSRVATTITVINARNLNLIIVYSPCSFIVINEWAKPFR